MITNQEMFDRAVRGLRSQGFERCLSADGEPVYNDGCGKRCAWGWVDDSIPPNKHNSFFVEGLAADQVGLACTLDIDQLAFARSLQWCHDDSSNPTTMQRRLRQLCYRERLTWPE
jgi:hypothetical protein